MQITLDTKEGKNELRRVIRLLQQIVDDAPSSSVGELPLPMVFGHEEKKEEPINPGLFSLFGDNPPKSLVEDKKDDDEDDADPIQIIDF